MYNLTMTTKKIFLVIFMLCVTANVVFAQETQQYEPVKIKIIKPTDAWHAGDFIKFNKKDLTIDENEVLGIRAVYSRANDSSGWALLNTILYQDKKYFIYADSTIPFSSDVLFAEDWISNAIVNWDEKSWIISYLLDILRSGDRNTFYKYEKDFINYLDDINEYDSYFDGWWRFRIIGNCLEITQSGINLGIFDDMGFWILNNRKINNGYQITVQGDMYFMEKEYKIIEN